MLHYKIFNQSVNSELPYLVFIAGFTASLEVWNPLVNQLDSYSVTNPILVIDNLGAGNSPQPDELYTTELMANHVVRLLKSLNITNFYLLGHSLGGAIAQHVALHDKILVARLFLASSFSYLDHVARLILTSRVDLAKTNADARTIALNSIATLFANRFLEARERQEFAIQRILDNTQTMSGMNGQLNACLTHDSRNIISGIQFPTTIITGTEDILVNPEHSRQLNNLIANSRLHQIAHCGHLVQLEQPDELAQIISANIKQK